MTGDVGPIDILHESLDIGHRLGAVVNVVRMLVHVERENRRAASKVAGVIARPLVNEFPVTMRIREQHPAGTAALSFTHRAELGLPALGTAEVAGEYRVQRALRLPVSAQAVE